MAFQSAMQRAERVEVQQGLSKLAPIHGTPTMFTRMKKLYGASKAWKSLMDSDAIALENMNSAWSIKDDKIYQFTATKNVDGWDIKLEETQPTTEIDIALRAQASNQMRIRAYALQSSSRGEEVLRLQDKLKQSVQREKEQEKYIKHLQEENKMLRASYLRANEVTEKAVTTTRVSWGWIAFILLLSLGLPLAKAEDCTVPVNGCYLDENLLPHRLYTWQDIQLYCSGETTVVIPSLSVDIENVTNQCVTHLQQSQMAYGANYRDWCRNTLKTRLHTVKCEKLAWRERMTTFSLALKNWATSEKARWLTKLVLSVATLGFHLYRCNYFGVAMTILFSLKTKYTLLTTLRMQCLLEEHVVTSLLSYLTGEFTLEYTAMQVAIFCLSVTTRFLIVGLTGVSQSLVSHCVAIGLDAAEVLSDVFEVSEMVHYILVPTVLTMLAGVSYTMSYVTIAHPDGTIEKRRNISLPKNLLLRAQNAVRGVIPQMPDRTHQIVIVESDIGQGVGWRFMNNIYTLKHVVGDTKVVKMTWQGLTVRANVEGEYQLFESVDALVKIKLPPEFQGIKPFRLVKKPQSDYMSLIAYDLQTCMPVTYTGWNVLDGVWLTNSFETRPGDSGAPYIDRSGRLVGVHMGTQGVVAQGYCVYDVLRNLKPMQEQSTDADEILYKVIEGTKTSHAALTACIEQLVERVAQLEKKLAETTPAKTEEEKQVQVEEKKKGKNKNRLKEIRGRFSRIKVLTEEQYQEMLDKGWSKEEIMEAVNQLRDRAFLDFLIEHEDDLDADDFDAEKYMDQHVISYESTSTKTQRGILQTPIQAVVETQRRKKKFKPYECRYCKKTYTSYHDIHKCRAQQKDQKEKEQKDDEKPSTSQEPKNRERGPEDRAPVKIFDWHRYVLDIKHRIAVPEPYPILGHININKLVERRERVVDPLTRLLTPWEQDEYVSATWTQAAYTKMFEKFHYSEPSKIEETYPDLWDFATKVVLHEYSYMQDSIILPVQLTEKNIDSTPAFPKFLEYDSEAAYLEENGWKEYVELWNMKTRPKVAWWVFLKNETLKKKKVEDNDIRMIMCTDPVFTRFGAAFDQHQNSLMKQHTEEKQAQVGWTPFYGGLNKRLQRLETKGDTFVEMDWTRFDGTIPRELFHHIKLIRWFFHAPSYKSRDNYERYKWYVENLENKIIVLPTGEVSLVQKGNPSGQISTTTDNNMVNTFLTAFEIAHFYKKKNGQVPTVEEYYKNVDSICYGDDRILAYNSSWVAYEGNDVPRFYKEVFGMWVKPENMKIQTELTGLSFCGMVFTKVSGSYYGVPNVNKILSTIEYPTKRLPTVEALWGKLTSLRILCEFADEGVKHYLDRQISIIREFCKAENIELPEVPIGFYNLIWTGGPKNEDGGSETQTTESA
nr:nonstructural protein [Avian astrovirus]